MLQRGNGYIPEIASMEEFPTHVPIEAAFLLVYAADDNGQIVRLKALGAGTTVSAAGKDFMKDTSHREAARWSGALDKLVSWGWVRAAGSKGQIFEVTDEGYRKDDVLKAGMQIDTSKEPLEELKEFDE